MPRSLVLCPTRELAAQVADSFERCVKNCSLTKALLIGGVALGEQDLQLDRGVGVPIATPGRLLDHIERGRVLLNDVKILITGSALSPGWLRLRSLPAACASATASRWEVMRRSQCPADPAYAGMPEWEDRVCSRTRNRKA